MITIHTAREGMYHGSDFTVEDATLYVRCGFRDTANTTVVSTKVVSTKIVQSIIQYHNLVIESVFRTDQAYLVVLRRQIALLNNIRVAGETLIVVLWRGRPIPSEVRTYYIVGAYMYSTIENGEATVYVDMNIGPTTSDRTKAVHISGAINKWCIIIDTHIGKYGVEFTNAELLP